jgi:hypothetical protein
MKKKEKERRRQYYLNNRERFKEYDRQYYLNNRERFKEYYRQYYLENREKKIERSKQWRLNNEEKKKENDKKYYLKNKEKIKKQVKIYRLNNKEKVKKCREKWRLNNKEKIKEHKRNKFRNNINYRLSQILRNRIFQALKGKSKSKNTMKLLGCDIEKLWNHLEKKFKPGMTRYNHGLWHVDHIRPCASFDLKKPKQQFICFHYTNLQPLWASENILKGAKYEME